MMPARVARPLTLIVAIPEHARSTRREVLGKLLTSLKPDDVSCIQFVPKYFIRVTLKSLEARQAVLTSGIIIDSHRWTVFEADPANVEVSLEHLPFEVTDDDIRHVLGRFGAVHEIRLQNYADTGIFTGTRILKMSLSSDIPVNLRVLRYPCRVLYRGQPRPCPICFSDDHRVFSCPVRDKCRLCLHPGHIARDCPVSSDRACDPEEESDDVSETDDEEFVSGDEEVVNAVPADTPPPPPSEPVPSLSEPLHVSELPGVPEPVNAPEPPSVSATPSTSEPTAAAPSSPTPPRRRTRATRSCTTSPFRWIKRFPEHFRKLILESGHTTNTHVYRETYHSDDCDDTYVYGIVDFSENTYRILQDVRTFEDVRFNDYRVGRVQFPDPVTFPGVQAAIGVPLSPDTSPSNFPIS